MEITPSNYRAPNADIWQGRPGTYWHNQVNLVNLSKDKVMNSGYALIGYACDEGVRRNQGRVGAIDGPEAIRKQLANWLGIMGIKM